MSDSNILIDQEKFDILTDEIVENLDKGGFSPISELHLGLKVISELLSRQEIDHGNFYFESMHSLLLETLSKGDIDPIKEEICNQYIEVADKLLKLKISSPEEIDIQVVTLGLNICRANRTFYERQIKTLKKLQDAYLRGSKNESKPKKDKI